MTLVEDADEFVRLHKQHGRLVGDSADQTLTGYRLTIECACGVTFVRHVSAGEPALDLPIFRTRDAGAGSERRR